MAVILLLLLVSCSSNWRVAYLQNQNNRKLDNRTTIVEEDDDNSNTVKVDSISKNKETNFSDIINEDADYKVTGENDNLNISAKDSAASVNLPPIYIIETREPTGKITDKGEFRMAMLIGIPKDIISPNWQIRVHPTISISKNKQIITVDTTLKEFSNCSVNKNTKI